MTARDPLTAAAEQAMADRGDREHEAAWEAADGYVDLTTPTRADLGDDFGVGWWREEQMRGWADEH